MNEAIIIRGLSYSYRSHWTRQMRRALAPFDLTINEGESFGFLGHNGAGKTTTIKCILDLIHPTSGTIEIFGIDHRRHESRRGVSYIPEQPYFYDNIRVLEIMHLYGTLAGISGRALTRRIEESLARVKMLDRADAPLRTLSKGLMQRVALAQSLIVPPRLLILDEPFSGLDPLGRMEFREIFSELRRNNTTLFISSHILSDVEYLCDRVSILAQGCLKGVYQMGEIPELASARYQLVLQESPEKLGKLLALSLDHRTQNSLTYIDFNDRQKAEKALSLALGHRFTIASYEYKQGTLEDLFIKVVGGSAKALD